VNSSEGTAVGHGADHFVGRFQQSLEGFQQDDMIIGQKQPRQATESGFIDLVQTPGTLSPCRLISKPFLQVRSKK
jgi:hypothetical protein